MNPKERLLAVAILAVNLAVGLALTRRADLRELLHPVVTAEPGGNEQVAPARDLARLDGSRVADARP